jgi:MSHA pilin protein MshA
MISPDFIKEHGAAVENMLGIEQEKVSMKQQGFTLIELVVVIVILGILAVAAAPKFIDLSEEAEAAALDGVVGAINSASAVNYAGAKAGDAAATKFTDATDTCTTMIAAILVEGAMPDGYTAPTAVLTQNDGDIVPCTITQTTTSGTNTKDAKIVWVE